MTRIRERRRKRLRLRLRPQAKVIEDRRSTKGIVGHQPADLELRAMRAVQSRQRLSRRKESLRVQSQKRREAVERRKRHQMLAAEYARDRRAA